MDAFQRYEDELVAKLNELAHLKRTDDSERARELVEDELARVRSARRASRAPAREDRAVSGQLW